LTATSKIPKDMSRVQVFQIKQHQPSISLTVSMDIRPVMRKSRCTNYGSRRVLKTERLSFDVDSESGNTNNRDSDVSSCAYESLFLGKLYSFPCRMCSKKDAGCNRFDRLKLTPGRASNWDKQG
jgi:hypothetical protein